MVDGPILYQGYRTETLAMCYDVARTVCRDARSSEAVKDGVTKPNNVEENQKDVFQNKWRAN